MPDGHRRTAVHDAIAPQWRQTMSSNRPLPSPFALPASEFNAFLFASIGEDDHGRPLSVVSALARLDIDPWQEAARLSGLPQGHAAATLDGLIQRLHPAGHWDQSETRRIAASLIELLPRPGAGVRPVEMNSRKRQKASPIAVVCLLLFALGAATLLGLSMNGTPRLDLRGSSPISNGPVLPSQ